jgi:hypothetical protein
MKNSVLEKGLEHPAINAIRMNAEAFRCMAGMKHTGITMTGMAVSQTGAMRRISAARQE